MGTLENATAILMLLTRLRKPVTVSDVMQYLEMPKSSASQLLKKMAGQGILNRDPVTLAYRPALKLLELAHMVRVSTPVLDMMENALATLCEQTGHTGYISVLEGRDVVVLRVHPGAHALRVVTYPGYRGPAWATSTGRALLARESDQDLLHRFGEGITALAVSGPRSMDELMRRIRDVRKTKWSVALGESLPGIGSVGCAVRDASTGETLAFCLSAPVSICDGPELERLGSLLRARASQIGRIVGDPFWSPDEG